MRKSVLYLLPLSVIAAVFLGACVSAPIQEMSDARQAISAARQVVDEAAPQQRLRSGIDEAAALLEQAESELRAGEYGNARDLARKAKAMAIEARERAAGDGIGD